jgi:acetyltransferase-like isoleucine patch superfamily enzyme
VTRNVPEYAIVAGVPAQVIGDIRTRAGAGSGPRRTLAGQASI